MFKSESITKLSVALLKAQSLMGSATKSSSNPYFKSKYADLGAVLEACKEALNTNGIIILQPIGKNEHGTYVETVLLHESGEFITSITPVVFSKENDPQAQGSAITYGRRYGLQSLISLPAEDDDGEGAMKRSKKEAASRKVESPVTLLQTADFPVSLSLPLDVPKTEAKPRTTFRKPVETQTVNGALPNSDDLGLN